MRNAFHFLALFILLAISMPQARALQSGSPEEALEEIATADDLAAVLKHMPVKVQEFLEKAPKQERAQLASKLLIKKNIEEEGATLTRSDAGSWEVIEKEADHKATLTIKKTFVAGTDALVQIELTEEKHGEKHSEMFWISMRFEADEWRLSQVGPWHGADIEAEFLRQNGAGDAHATTPAATLRTLNTAMVSYITTYPDVGYPSTLKALSGEQNQEPSPEHAMLVEPLFLKDPAIKGAMSSAIPAWGTAATRSPPRRSNSVRNGRAFLLTKPRSSALPKRAAPPRPSIRRWINAWRLTPSD